MSDIISIIVPAYNAERYLRRCLDSVIAQTYDDLEIILVNDGSSDGTAALAKNYASRDSRIRLIDKPNGGVSSARNTGLECVSSEAFLYVDSDDWVEPNMVERLAKLMDESIDIVFCGNDAALCPGEIKPQEVIQLEEWDGPRQRLEFMRHERMTGMLWNKLMRTELANGIRFNEATGYGEDAEFLWQILKRSNKMIVTNEVLYHHVMEEGSISHQTFSDTKYSAVPMWEHIYEEASADYPELAPLAKRQLMKAAVSSCYEIRRFGGYKNKPAERHMRAIIRRNVGSFLKADVSCKFKLYAVAACIGI